jgi:tetratricopeptide (TPR) repeat protein
MKTFANAILLALFIFSGLRCKQEPAPAKALQLPGTAKMAALLLEANASLDPMKIQFYASSRRAEQFQAIMNSVSDPAQKMMAYLQYSYELLSAGKNEQAVVEFEKLLKMTENAGYQPDFAYQIKKLLALAYMRIGETSNCIQRYNPDACIIPLKGEGIYSIQEGSRSAIKIYESMLQENPDDYESLWMLNFAYMTLGEYPDGVPEKWRIPEASFQSDAPFPQFPNIADKVGVATVALSGGACVEDFNNDGLLDIIASSWGPNDPLRYFVNNGDGGFTEKSAEAGLTGLTGGLNTNHVDYNNDGFMDILVLRGAWYGKEGKLPNSLIKNNGDGTFEDVTVAAGLLNYAPTQAATWADFNRDGWLDLFIGNESGLDYTFTCELYINNKNGTFTNRINEAGLGNFFTYVKGCFAGDVNNDGWPDLYISSLNAPNMLLVNNGVQADGNVTFSDASDLANVGEPLVSFPCWMFDFNHDGLLDIFAGGFGVTDGKVAAFLAAQNYRGQKTDGTPHLYINKGNGAFEDISDEAGLDEALFVMGSNYGDLDNDGLLDLFLGTGAPGLTAIVPNKVYRNDQGRRLLDVTTAGGFGHVQKGHGVGFGDFDNDGDQDIFSVIGGAFEGDVFADAFYLNPIGSQKSWVTLRLQGTVANRSAIGARVKVTAVDRQGKEREFHHLVSTGSSFGSNSLQLEIGLDDATLIKRCEVRWPDMEMTTEVFSDLAINKTYRIVQGKGSAEEVPVKSFSFGG